MNFLHDAKIQSENWFRKLPSTFFGEMRVTLNRLSLFCLMLIFTYLIASYLDCFTVWSVGPFDGSKLISIIGECYLLQLYLLVLLIYNYVWDYYRGGHRQICGRWWYYLWYLFNVVVFSIMREIYILDCPCLNHFSHSDFIFRSVCMPIGYQCHFS